METTKNLNGGRFNNLRSDVAEMASKTVETVGKKTSFFARNWKEIVAGAAGTALVGTLVYYGFKSLKSKAKKAAAEEQSSDDNEE